MGQLFSFIRRMKQHWLLRRSPIEYARAIGVSIGEDCRLLGLTTGTFGSEPYLVSLGNHVTVTSGVSFITHDGGVWVFRKDYPDIDVIAPITVGNNVFIGINSILMPGVSIGDDCVIGAGAVVTRDIPPGNVAVGVPARPIKLLDEYWQKVQKQAIYARSLEPHEKRILYEHLFVSQMLITEDDLSSLMFVIDPHDSSDENT